MKKYFLIGLFIVWNTSISAQHFNTDSLLTILPTAPDTAKISILIQLCKASRYTDTKKALTHGKQALVLAEDMHTDEKIAEALLNVSITLRIQGEYDEALDKAFDALSIYKRLIFERGMANSLYTIGNIYDFQGNYPQALDYLSQSLKIYLRLNAQEDIAMVYNNIGIIYENEKNDSMALSFYHKAMDIYEKMQNPLDKPKTLNNIGLVLLRQDKYAKALDCFNNALKIIKNENNKYGIALLTNNIGTTHKAQRNYAQALPYFQQALNLQEELDDKFGMAITLDNLGDTHRLMNNYLKAIDYATQSLSMAQSIGAKEVAKRASETLAEIYKHQKNYQEALAYQGLYMQYKDSLFNESKEREIGRLEASIDLQLQQSENELLLKDNLLQQETIRRQQTVVISTFLFLALLGILAMVLYRSNRLKQKTNQLITRKNQELTEKNVALEVLNREKNNIMSIVAHDMKAPLNKINGLAQLIPLSGQLSAQQKTYVNMMQEVIRNGGELINNLVDVEALDHNHVTPRLHPLSLGAFIAKVIQTHALAANHKHIAIYFDHPDHEITLRTDESFLMRILDNLLSNAIKFSEPSSKIYVTCAQNNSHVAIRVKDEGQGISPEDQQKMFKKFQKLSARPTAGESSSGLGLSITKALVEKLGGKISVESEVNQGATFCVMLPL